MLRICQRYGARPVLLLSSLVLSGSCGNATTVDTDVSRQTNDVASAPAVPAGAAPVTFQTIAGTRTQHSRHTEPSRVVIRERPAWATFWQGIVAGVSPEPPVPAIDFTRHMVLGATLGQRPSGGFTIDIDSVFSSGGTVFAVVRTVSPGPFCGVAAVMTAPTVAVLIDRVDAPVRFVERSDTTDCD